MIDLRDRNGILLRRGEGVFRQCFPCSNNYLCPYAINKFTTKEKTMKKWLKSRLSERTSWDGAVCIALGLMILFMSPLAKIAAGLAIAWGVWTIWKKEK